jgi:hypothetical protein
MSNPDFFFYRPTSSRVLFFEYSSENPDFQSDLHEIYRPGSQASDLPFKIAKVSAENKCEVIALTYDHPSRNPDLIPGVYFDLSYSENHRQSMLEFALALGYEATLDDIPELLDHKEAIAIGVGLFPGRESLAFHMVYKGEAHHFSNLAEIDPKYKNFAFQYVLTKEGTSRHAVEFFDNFETLGFAELADHVAHCKSKVTETYGDRVRLSEICSYKFFLDQNEKKVYYRVLLND